MVIPSFIRPKEDQPSPTKALERGLNLKNILKSSEPIKHESITTFSLLRQEVYEEIRQSEQIKVSYPFYQVFISLQLQPIKHYRIFIDIIPTGYEMEAFSEAY